MAADFEPDSWTYKRNEVPRDIQCVRIEIAQGRDTILYAVRQSGACMNADGEWDLEPIPSSRTDEWLNRFRFNTFLEAAHAVRRHVKHPWGRFSHYDKSSR